MFFTVCGEYKSLEDIPDVQDAPNLQEVQQQNAGTCTNVIISDRYVLTAAHCFELL